MHAGVGDQAEHARIARDLVNAHLHAGVNRAHQHIHFVALHQLAGVLNALGGLGLVIHLEVFNLAATQLATLLGNGHAKAVFNRHAQLRKRAGVGQHQADANLVGLGAGNLGQQQRGGGCADEGGTAGQDEAAGGHVNSLVNGFMNYIACLSYMRSG